jgi:hypothetical protein
MSRYSLIVACVAMSAPLMMTNFAHAAPKKSGGGSRPAASRSAPARAHAAPARASHVHPGTAHAGASHAKTAPAAHSHTNAAKANHSQTNAGKNGSHINASKSASQGSAGKNGGGQKNFPGRGYRGFSNSRWLADFAAWTYYNPDDATWYYWYEPSDMFLPVSYINDYRPVPTTTNDNTSTPPAGLLSRP